MQFKQPFKIPQGMGTWSKLQILHLMVSKKIRSYLFIECIEYWNRIPINGQHMSLKKDIVIPPQSIAIS